MEVIGGIHLYHVLTNPIANENATVYKINIYKTRVMDVNKRHEQNYALVNELAFHNNRQKIAYFEKYIASFHPIQNWGHHPIGEHEYRSIDPTNPTDRELLERLLLKEIEQTPFVSRYYNALHGDFLIKEESVVGDLSIRGCLTLQCHIDTEGGFTSVVITVIVFLKRIQLFKVCMKVRFKKDMP